MSNQPLLQVKNLSISVEQYQADPLLLVDHISFEIGQQEIVGLVGESGSGKSITSLSILGLLADQLIVSNGEIHFESINKDILKLSEKELQTIRGNRIAMIFQEPMSSLNPVMTCGSQVDEMILVHQDISKSEAKQRTLELFEKVQLPDPYRAYNAYPHQLSGGQLQRIMIAMALSCDPDLLIADECTTALDVTVQKEIIDLLKQLNDSLKIAILFISHDLGVISDIADRIIVMRNGKIVEQGITRDIFNNPKHPYTFQLTASKPPLDQVLSKLPKPDFFSSEHKNGIQDFYDQYAKTEEDIQFRKNELENSEVLVEIKDLVKFYPQKRNFWGKPTAFVKAVNHVSFSIKKGETLGLVGESGCGKSTLSKALLRLIEADQGDVLYQGDSLFELSPKAMRKKRKEIQYIFQDPYSSLNPRLKVGFAIHEPMTVHSILNSKQERRDRAVELLELVGLEADHFNRFPHQFSGGQRQRICIARALAMNPQFIVCDEIVSALDVSVQAQVLNLLIDLRQKFDLTLLFVSHDLSIVKFISDRLIVMKDGIIEEQGWADEIYKNPTSIYTQNLLNSIPGQLTK